MRKQLSRVVVTLVVLAAILAGTGCGNSGDDTSSEGSTTASSGSQGTPPISKAALIKQGDAICEEGREKIALSSQSLSSAGPGEREEAEIDLASEVLVDVLKTDIDDLRALGAPDGDEEQVEAILDSFQELLEKAETEPEAFVVSEDPSAQPPDPWREADKQAEAYGFKACPRS